MNITQMAFEFITRNPDQKMRDIIAASPDCKSASVKGAVCRLYTEERLGTKATSCGFIYWVINDASCRNGLQDDPKSRGNLEQERAAKKLEGRSLYHRAATVWHQLSTLSCSQKALEYYIRQKNACLRKARVGKSYTECLLARNYCGGDLYVDRTRSARVECWWMRPNSQSPEASTVMLSVYYVLRPPTISGRWATSEERPICCSGGLTLCMTR